MWSATGHAPVAHRIERPAPDRKAAGSIPARRTTYASRPKITSPRGAPWSYICAVELPPSGPPEAQPPPSMQPYATPQPAAYYIAPTDGGAVWALVLGVLGFVTCPIIGLIAFFTGSSAL